MRKWVRIERSETGDGFFIATGYEEACITTLFVSNLDTAFRTMREYFGELPAIEIDVKEGPIGFRESVK